MKSCSHSQKMGHGKGKSSNRQIMKIFMRHGILNNVSATKVLHSLMTHLNYLCLWHLNCLYQSFVILPPLHKIHAQNALKKKQKKINWVHRDTEQEMWQKSIIQMRKWYLVLNIFFRITRCTRNSITWWLLILKLSHNRKSVSSFFNKLQ